MKTRGFSLLELIVVLFILGLSIGLIAPSFSRVSKSAELKATARKLSSLLRNSRSEAVLRGEIQRILFDLPSKTVKVQSFKPEALEEEGTKEGPSQVRTFMIPAWIQIREVKTSAGQFPPEEPAIEFYPNGSSSGGSFLLEGDDQRPFRIEVHSITGAVKIERMAERI
ncbi:MAG: GspH/FimT family pseudopilin [Desulfobacterota bacterium]|nr:GspH/FimT family pseudopilin [Thermodesulfobacteriota bacterium]